MKNLKYIFRIIIFLIIASSCSHFEDTNIDQNSPTVVTPGMLTIEVLKGTFRSGNPVSDVFKSENLFNKHTAFLGAEANPNQYYSSFWPFVRFNPYLSLTNLKRVVELSKGSSFESSYKGLSLFLKAYKGFKMTTQTGDIPYSEAGKFEDGIRKPKYDKQADVFALILKDLKKAEELFAEGKQFDGDIMFGGNPEKWRKLCNAMQLKVLQTMSKKITTEQKTRFNAIVSAGNLMESNADNLQLVYTTNSNANHPFYKGEKNRIELAVSKLVVDALKTNNDRRLFYFAEPAGALIDGGKLASNFDAYEGAPTALASEQLNRDNEAKKYSLLNKRYVEVPNGDPMIHFSYTEQCFIIAEAIEEGWVVGANAKEYYENGVKAALNYYKSQSAANIYVHGVAIDDAYISGYFSGAAAYNTAGTKEDRLKQILTQRWLIDFFQGNGGNYPQFLRTGYPKYPIDSATSLNTDASGKYPKRWKYPTSEQTTNPDNYKKAIDEQYAGFDNINGTPWYLKN